VTVGAAVRLIRADEGLRLRALRLRALADAPLAFSSTLAEEAAYPDDLWHGRAQRSAAGVEQVTYVAEEEDRWVGMATGLAGGWRGPATTLVSMFVEPSARRRGLGVALVEEVTAWARGRGMARLHLWVTETNDPAVLLYRRCGFRPTGERQPVEHTPTVAEIEMARDL
jgi:GNAT superfamily N-acetyltransferase